MNHSDGEKIFDAIRGKAPFQDLIDAEKEMEDIDEKRDPDSPLLYGEYMDFRLRYFAHRKDTIGIIEGVVKYFDSKIENMKHISPQLLSKIDSLSANLDAVTKDMEGLQRIPSTVATLQKKLEKVVDDITMIQGDVSTISDSFDANLAELGSLIVKESEQLSRLQKYNEEIEKQSDLLDRLGPIVPYFEKEMERLSDLKKDNEKHWIRRYGPTIGTYILIIGAIGGLVKWIVGGSLEVGGLYLAETEKSIKSYVEQSLKTHSAVTDSKINTLKSENTTFKNVIENNFEVLQEKFEIKLKKSRYKKKGTR